MGPVAESSLLCWVRRFQAAQANDPVANAHRSVPAVWPKPRAFLLTPRTAVDHMIDQLPKECRFLISARRRRIQLHRSASGIDIGVLKLLEIFAVTIHEITFLLPLYRL